MNAEPTGGQRSKPDGVNDYLTPEQRMNLVAALLADIALRALNAEDAEKNDQ